MIPQLALVLAVFILVYPALQAIMFLRICLHEFGHYCAIRFYGFRVALVEIGQGPVMFSRTDRRGTRWTLRRQAEAGYVEMDYGSENAMLSTKPRAKLLISAAGPAMDVMLIAVLTIVAGVVVMAAFWLHRQGNSEAEISMCLTAATSLGAAGLLSAIVYLDLQCPDPETDMGQIEGLRPLLAPQQDRRDRLMLIFVSALRLAPKVVFPAGLALLAAIFIHHLS